MPDIGSPLVWSAMEMATQPQDANIVISADGLTKQNLPGLSRTNIERTIFIVVLALLNLLLLAGLPALSALTIRWRGSAVCLRAWLA
jgi:hypothetical protein